MQSYTPTYLECFQHQQPTDLLHAVVEQLRPSRKNKSVDADTRVTYFTNWLKENPAQSRQLANAVEYLLAHNDLRYVFSESGMLAGNNFFAELNRRLSDKFVPHLLPSNDLRVAIRRIFNKPTDYKWMREVKLSTWMKFCKTLNLQVQFSEAAHLTQLTDAAEILSLRIAALGIDPRITQKSAEALKPYNAFTAQYAEWSRYKQQIAQLGSAPTDNGGYHRLMQAIDLSLRQVREIQKLKKTQGTSLQQTFVIERLSQHLERLQIIITLIDPETDVTLQTNIQFFLQVIHNENTQNRVRTLFSSNVSYLAFQIAEHGSKTGEKYITSNRKEYWQFFVAAAIGGIIISFAALIKVGLTSLHLPYFWASFTYGFNYAIAFIVIHFLHGTIATKQPALTASTLAQAIGSEQHNVKNLAQLIAQVCRSQFASLMGNLVIVLPLTIFIAIGYHLLFGAHVIDPDAAAGMLNDVQLSVRNLWFAAVAGILLFGSGIVSGYFDNLVIFSRIPERLKVHAGLLRRLGENGTAKIAGYIEKNLGALMGNILLGFGLGFMIFFGKILGVPLDIRHVTISTGFFGFSITSLDFQLSLGTWLWCFAGLAGIAFTNLAVSFSLALYVALKSRRISTVSLLPLLALTLRYFLHFPSHFFLPPIKKPTTREVATEPA